MTPPRKFSALPPQDLYEASPKAISRRTSYLRVRLEFLPYPHLIPTLFNGCGFGPPLPFTATSTWTWIDHPVSGLLRLTTRPIKTWFPFGSIPSELNLASQRNSPDRSTKSTRFITYKVVPQLVNIWFQVLFHSPPGVLFTFPSQYYALSVTKEYLALRGGPRVIQSRFHVSRPTLDTAMSTRLSLTGLSPSLAGFPKTILLRLIESIMRSEPRHARTPVWALPVSLAATSRITCCFLFLRLLRCFSSPGSPPIRYGLAYRILEVCSSGFPHSEISGSLDICSSPKLFAAYHVFHRLLVPRHPPYALISITNLLSSTGMNASSTHV